MPSRLANLSLALVSTIAALVVCEMAVRSFAPSWLEFRMEVLERGANPGVIDVGTDRSWPVDRLGGRFHRFRPGASFSVVHGEYQHEVRIDEQGGRFVAPRDSGRNRLPVFGDSFTFGVGVNDGETFLALLAREVEFQLVNLGVPGTTISHHLDLVRIRHEELGRPERYLFVVFLGNDLMDLINVSKRQQAVSKRVRPAGGSTWVWRLNAWTHESVIFRESYAFQLIRQRILSWHNARGLSAADPVFLMARQPSAMLDEGKAYLDAELRRLDSLSTAMSFDPHFLLIPDRNQISPSRRALMVEYYDLAADQLAMFAVNELYRSAILRYGWNVFDASPCLERHDRPDDLYYVNDNHLTATGHRAQCSSGFMAQVGGPSDAHGERRSSPPGKG